MPDQAKYFLGRVIKLGDITSEQIALAVSEPVPFRLNDFHYTFTEVRPFVGASGLRFIYAKLAKYRPLGAIEVVEPEEHSERTAEVTNLLVASSPFVYLPEFSGIAYQHIWNRLEREQFEKTFGAMVTEKFSGFFRNVSVEPIADLRTFVQNISRLDRITKIDATVHPPNPLFGPAWESLRDYLRRRNLEELNVKEDAASSEGIRTNIPQLAAAVLEHGDDLGREAARVIGEQSGVGDAAVLMAADGYGKAKVQGTRGERRVVVRTQESQIHFSFDKDPEPESLYAEARAVLERINDDRYLDHS